MTEGLKLSLDTLRLIQAKQARARDQVELAISSQWHQLGNRSSEERQWAGRQQIIQLLGAYASKFFDLEAEEYVALKLKASELIRRLDELADRVKVRMIPLQFRIDSFFHLEDLHRDSAYRKFILSAVEDRVVFWKKGLVHEAGESGSPRAILDGYREREKLTIAAFAEKAGVDESVIYALRANRKGKCGAETLARIASLVGCEPCELVPDE